MPPKQRVQQSGGTKVKATHATSNKGQATLIGHVVASKSNTQKDVKRKRKQEVTNYGIAGNSKKQCTQSPKTKASAASVKPVSPPPPAKAGPKGGKAGAKAATKAKKERKEYVDTVKVDGETFNTGDSVYVVLDADSMKNFYENVHYCCEVCDKKGTAKNVLLECSRCLGGFHLSCLTPPLQSVPEGDWVCDDCEAGKQVRKSQSTCARERVLQLEGLCLARIETMWKVPSTDSYDVSLRWYCLPEETCAGRQPHNAAREVFLTQQRDVNSLKSLLRPAHILPPKDFQRNTLCSDDVFLCEYEYDTVWQRFRRRGEFDSESESGDEWSEEEEQDWSDGDDEDHDASFDPSHFAKGLLKDSSTTGVKRGGHGGSSSSGKGSSKGRGFRRRKQQGGAEFGHVGTAQIPTHVRHRDRSNPLVQARDALTLATVPRSLPCRESERERVVRFVEDVLTDDATSSGKCLYISGIPGTGKTATVLEVMRQMRSKAEAGSIPQFQFIEVNGLRLPSPSHAYSCVLEALTGEHAGPATAMNTLERLFTSRGSNAQPLIVLLDEMDLLVNKTQTVLYNMFDWPSRKGSKISIIGIANTMDLPERLHPRIGSRLGGQRLVFHPYKREQLETIVRSRLEGISAFEPNAITLVARKVANCSGDVRRCLELCRRAAEVAQEMQLSPTAAQEGGESNEQAAQPSVNLTVTMRHVDLAIREAFNTCHVRLLREACRLERLLLAAIHLDGRYTGKSEVVLESVLERLKTLCFNNNEAQYAVGEVLECLIGLGSKRLIMCDPGNKRLKAKIALNIPSNDLIYVLGNDSELPWLASRLAVEGQQQ